MICCKLSLIASLQILLEVADSGNNAFIDIFYIIACATPSTTTPESHDGTTEAFTLTTGVALFTLDSGLDYEVNTVYSVVMEVVDTGKTPPSTGTITVKVQYNHCLLAQSLSRYSTVTVY